jgi:hypothetical protein
MKGEEREGREGKGREGKGREREENRHRYKWSGRNGEADEI